MNDGNVTDDTRIRAALPTIKHLSEQGAKVILASHLGRPKGEVVEELRLDPVAKHLSNLLGKEVLKTDEVYGAEVDKAIDKLKIGRASCRERVKRSVREEGVKKRINTRK